MALHTTNTGVIWTPAELTNWTPRTGTDDFRRESNMDDDAPRLKLWTSKELLDTEFPPVTWTIPGLIPTGLTAVVGAPKTGKSFLALGIGTAASVGGAVLGRIRVPTQQVLCLALEDTPRRLQSRLQSVGALGSDYFTVATEWERGDKGTQWLARYLDSHSDTTLVIIDTWARFAAVRDHNDYGQTTDAAATLKRIADDRDISIVILHHSRKGTSDDWLESVLGSTGLAGAVDTALLLRRGRGKREAELHVTGRDVEEQDYALTFDADTGTWAIEGTLDEIQATNARQEIVDLLADHPAGLMPKEVAAALDKNRSTTRTLLGRMVDDGALINVSGRYTVKGVDSVDSRQRETGVPVYASTVSTVNEGFLSVPLSADTPATRLPRVAGNTDAAQYLENVASATTILGGSE